MPLSRASTRQAPVTAAPLPLPSDADSTGRSFGADELSLLADVICSGTLNCTRGVHVDLFERAFAAMYGVQYARAVSSGTAAIHTAIAALDPEPGDEIITTPITDMGAIAPILYQRALPIFADVDPVTLNVTPDSIAERIGPRTRAIIATHLFGNPCDIGAIYERAAARGIPVIEDCAQAFLATSGGCLVGTIGDIGAFSLQQGKHLSSGEGGITITNDASRARHMRLFSDKGWGYGDDNPDHYFLALNYRMSELQGAVARAQLSKLDWIVTQRQQSAARLTQALKDTPGLILPQPLPGSTHVYWKYPLIVDPEYIGGGADSLGRALRERGIQCIPRYIKKPAFECRVFTERRTFGNSQCPFSCIARERGQTVTYDIEEFPGTKQGLERVVVLPWNEFYDDAHVDFIATAVRDAVDALAGLSAS